jgi:acyl carrier protein
MVSNVASRIAAVFAEVLAASGREPVELAKDTPLDASLGLESIDFAEIVVRLESELGKDPFASGDAPAVATFGEFVALYE